MLEEIFPSSLIKTRTQLKTSREMLHTMTFDDASRLWSKELPSSRQNHFQKDQTWRLTLANPHFLPNSEYVGILTSFLKNESGSHHNDFQRCERKTRRNSRVIWSFSITGNVFARILLNRHQTIVKKKYYLNHIRDSVRLVEKYTGGKSTPRGKNNFLCDQKAFDNSFLISIWKRICHR